MEIEGYRKRRRPVAVVPFFCYPFSSFPNPQRARNNVAVFLFAISFVRRIIVVVEITYPKV
jgi:hypothetical protein